MKIELDLDYDEAVALRERLRYEHGDLREMTLLDAVREDICAVLTSAIDNEDERRGVAHAEAMLESGGVRDAGRGHLLR